MKPSEDLTVEALGTTFTIRWGSGVGEAHRNEMLRAWSRCLAAPRTGASQDSYEPTTELPYSATLNFEPKAADGGVRQLQADTFERLAESLTSELTFAAIVERAGELTMLHACGVADPDSGAVIALAAKSGTGKTTAAAVLAKTLSYVTDETVAIRMDGAVISYPKPLSIKQSAPEAAKVQVGPDQLGLTPAPARTQLKVIVVLDREAGFDYGRPELTRMLLADAVLALAPNTSSQTRLEAPVQSLCRLIDSVGGVWKVRYSEASDLAEVLAPLLHPDAPAAERGRSGSWRAAEVGVYEGELTAGCLRRSKAIDAVEIDGDLLVMLNDEIIRLSGIAPFIWQAAVQAVGIDELVELLEARYGLPEDYQSVLGIALGELIARGVLVQG